jgi:hypothetical protein
MLSLKSVRLITRSLLALWFCLAATPDSYAQKRRLPVSAEAAELPSGRQGVAYEFRFEAENSLSPTRWRVRGGELPPGLKLDATGLLRGTPLAAKPDAYSFVVEVTELTAAPRRFAQAFGLFIEPAPLRIKTPSALRIRSPRPDGPMIASLAVPVGPAARPTLAGRGLASVPLAEAEGADEAETPAVSEKPNAASVAAPVEIVSPAEDDVVHVNQVELRLRFNDEAVQKFSVSVKGSDGKEVVQVKERRVERGEDEARAVVNLALGGNEITVTAGGKKIPATIKVTRTLTREAEDVAAEAARSASSGGNSSPPAQTPALVKNLKIEEGVHEGDEKIRVSGAEPSKEYKVLRNGAEVGNTLLRADVGGEFIWTPPANQPLSAGETLSFKEKDDVSLSRSFDVQTVDQKYDTRAGAPVGYLMGGLVLSQQAQEFKQSDPFFGFTGGYRFGAGRKYASYKSGDGSDEVYKVKVGVDGRPLDRENYVLEVKEAAAKGPSGEFVCNGQPCTVVKMINNCSDGKCTKKALVRVVDSNGREVKGQQDFRNTGQVQLRFFGIFQSAPRAVEMGSPTSVPNPVNFQPFISSRKSFDSGVRLWYEFPRFTNWFTLGAYGTWGASSALSKTELEGESAAVRADGRTAGCTLTSGGTGSTTGGNCPIKIDNDLKQFKEAGLMMDVSLFNRQLYLQSWLGYGNYEALKGLAPCSPSDRAAGKCEPHNTQNRFVGKLWMFPGGLNRDFGGQRAFAPMFGVEMNSGYGQDQIKFFVGSIIRIRSIGF